MTYTQGPWTIDYAMNDYEGHYLNGAGRLVAITNTVENEVTDEDRANARLIASAPDLLFCLQTLLREKVEEYGDPNDLDWIRFADCDPSGAWHSAYQAIAKATGAEVEA